MINLEQNLLFAQKIQQVLPIIVSKIIGAVRALMNAGQQTAKWFYSGPMFRYERPQKGRLRQFHQIGVEHFHTKSNAIADIEIIALGHQVLSKLGLENSISVIFPIQSLTFSATNQ
jgi:histidyl-tRNA synthetase